LKLFFGKDENQEKLQKEMKGFINEQIGKIS